MAALKAPRGLGRLFQKDDLLGARRDASRDLQARQLSKRVGESAAPNRVNGVKFVKGATGVVPVDVPHLLGKPAKGFRIVNLDKPVMITQGAALHPHAHINLTCTDTAMSATGDTVATADIEVW